MAVVNRERGFLFLAEPHCGGRAVEEALMRLEGSETLNAWMHAPLDKIEEEIGDSRNLYKFCVVRHPADWLVTRYLHMTGWHAQGFPKFISYYLDNAGDRLFRLANTVDKVIRYERLEQELNEVLEALGVTTPLVLNVIGQTKDKGDWREYYTSKELVLLRETFKDYESYGYPRDDRQ